MPAQLLSLVMDTTEQDKLIREMLNAFDTVAARLRALGDPDHAELVTYLRRGYELLATQHQSQVEYTEQLQQLIDKALASVNQDTHQN